jgi:hypothetical protein
MKYRKLSKASGISGKEMKNRMRLYHQWNLIFDMALVALTLCIVARH